jgi:hypothetical protein
VRYIRSFSLSAVLVLGSGCASTDVSPPSTSVEPTAPDCKVAPASGDVEAILRANGELVIVGGAVELLRSSDSGRSWRREEIPVRCKWPSVAEVGDRLLVSCSEQRPPGSLLVLGQERGGAYRVRVEVDASPEIFIDTHLQALPGGELLLFATHVDRPENLTEAVYTVQVYRSGDRGLSWSRPEPLVVGRRGEHIEDTRAVVLPDGALLVAFEVEKTESAPSTVRQLRSADGGRTWSRPATIWDGGDVEPGGYVLFDDGELWFVASSDELAGGGSYRRALILNRRSTDDGWSWSAPEVLVDREDQLSYGGVVLPGGEILLPSVRHFKDRSRRQLSLYLVDRDPTTGAWCASPPLTQDGFENGLGDQWRLPTSP